jgi:hypothetical protein
MCTKEANLMLDTLLLVAGVDGMRLVQWNTCTVGPPSLLEAETTISFLRLKRILTKMNFHPSLNWMDDYSLEVQHQPLTRVPSIRRTLCFVEWIYHL